VNETGILFPLLVKECAPKITGSGPWQCGISGWHCYTHTIYQAAQAEDKNIL